MARGTNAPPVAAEEREVELLLGLAFGDGTEQHYFVDPAEAAAVLRGYAVPARVFRSRRVFDMVAEYVEKHADHRGRRGSDAEPDIHAWDRGFMARVDDTHTLYDLLRAAETLEDGGLMDLCARKTADMVRGGTVEEIRSLLGIADDDVTPEQDQAAQDDHDRLLRIIL